MSKIIKINIYYSISQILMQKKIKKIQKKTCIDKKKRYNDSHWLREQLSWQSITLPWLGSRIRAPFPAPVRCRHLLVLFLFQLSSAFQKYFQKESLPTLIFHSIISHSTSFYWLIFPASSHCNILCVVIFHKFCEIRLL